jgi:hypothetical protein
MTEPAPLRKPLTVIEFTFLPDDAMLAAHARQHASLQDLAELALLHCEDAEGNHWTLWGDGAYLRAVTSDDGEGRIFSWWEEETRDIPSRFPVHSRGWHDEWNGACPELLEL